MQQFKGIKKALGMESDRPEDKLFDKFRERATGLAIPNVMRKDEQPQGWAGTCCERGGRRHEGLSPVNPWGATYARTFRSRMHMRTIMALKV